MSTKLCFVLPRFVKSQSGGYKMVYEYANRLQKRGFQVTILYLNEFALLRYHFPEKVRRFIINLMTDRGPEWFELDNRIKKISTCRESYIDEITDVDVAVFTAAETVSYSDKFRSSKKIYFIQDYENWKITDEAVKKTYGLGFSNIVVAQWLKNIVDNYSTIPSVLIKNPVNQNVYHPIIPIDIRCAHSVSLNYRSEDYKGFRYSFQAVQILLKKYPDLQVYIFGTEKRPKWFPHCFKYTRYASQKQTVAIYNNTAIFICGTVEEGYGLTGLEAMACGTALVSTDYLGVHEYAENGVNALLSPVRDSVALAENAIRLIEDQRLRVKIAKSGVDSVIQAFDWKVAVDKFEEVIQN